MPTREEKNTFSLKIMELAKRGGISHLDAMGDYCTETGLEIEVAAKLVNTTLRQHISKEAAKLKLVKPESTAKPLQ